MKNNRHTKLTVGRLRRALIYKPLVVLMSVLLLPAIPWVERGGVGVPFQADAQIAGCRPFDNAIVRDYCTADGTYYGTELKQLEADAVKAYLATHKMPASEASVIYEYGRTDLRTKIRTLMSTTLLGIVSKDPSIRTAHEQRLYTWLQGYVQQNEIALYTKAVAHYNAWVNDPCHFTLDSTLATAYGISYNGAPFCGNSLSTFFGLPVPTVPSLSYFKAYGLKNSYTAAAADYPKYGTILADMTIDTAVVAGIATTAGVVIAGTTTALLVSSVAGALALFTQSGFAASVAVETSFVISGAAVSNYGVIGVAAGPVSAVLVGIAIGVVAAMQVFDHEASVNQLKSLKTSLTGVTNTPPDLKSFVSDSTGLGSFKIQAIIASQTTSDVPSTKTLPAHRDGVDPVFLSEAVTGAPFTYRDWDQNIWTAHLWGGWIVQTCQKGPTSTKVCSQTDSITADIRYRQPTHTSPNTVESFDWTASRLGSTFLHTRGVLWRGYDQHPCEADASTGQSTEHDISNCSSYVTPSLTYEDGNGGESGDLITEFTTPVFSTPTYLSFTAGVPSTQIITMTSNPKDNVIVANDGGTLASNPDFKFTWGAAPNFNTLLVEFNGNPTAPNQDYTLNVRAATSAVWNQTYTVSVQNGLKITSPGILNATAGTPVNFLVTATGSPAPQLSIDPSALVDGLTFTDHGNGTATIAGVPTLPGEYQCLKADLNTGTTRPCGIIASNASGTIEQPFTINLASSPAASIVPPIGATFTAGVENRVLLTASGATTPVSWTFFPDPSAPWLSLQDNGTGSAVLIGTPPLGTTGTFSPAAVPTALGSRGIAPVFPVTVVSRVQFSSPNSAAFTVGSPGSFAVSANMGTISLDEDEVLPEGLSFTSGNPASITGVAAAGSGGQYTVRLTGDAGGGELATQPLTLNVYEAPQVTSANKATMFVGMPGSFALTTTGFPSVSTHVIPQGALPPASPDTGDGMHFTVTGLPAGLTASNLNPHGFATGTLTIQGTPATAGFYPLTITAQNGVGTPVQQTLMLNIVGITGPAPASGTKCNGNYTGTFRGNITVSAGQNCSFYGGGVAGSVKVLGGNFAATEATITGNVSIQGAAGFSISAGTRIAGNLSVLNAASASTTNQICGSSVAGNVLVSTNAIPISIGSGTMACLGNTFGANVDITSNTAPIQVYDNFVGKNLSCSTNASITGASNLAQRRKSGQCSGF